MFKGFIHKKKRILTSHVSKYHKLINNAKALIPRYKAGYVDKNKSTYEVVNNYASPFN